MAKRHVAAAAASVTAIVLLASAPAAAAPGERAGVFSVWTGSPLSAVSLAPGFPSATISSDDPALSVASTATLTGASEPGSVYGTSSGYQHLSLSPRSLGGGAWAATSTTLTFESPTPAYGWSFVLGDIDSEILSITATGPSGAVSSSDLGYVSSFDLTPPLVVAAWSPETGELAAPTGDDTSGSNAWFSPTVPLTTLTVTTTRRQGSPTAYLWLAAQTASLAGSVTDTRADEPEPVPAAVVEISAPGGGTLPGTGGVELVTTTDESGQFEVEIFPGVVELSSEAPDAAPSETITVTPVPLEADPSLFNFPDPVSVEIQPAVVTPEPEPEPGPGPVPAVVAAPQLPPTGLDAAPIVVLGAVLLGAGVALCEASRRRVTSAT